MDKTFSDLMDIVNRSKKYDTETPKPRAKKVEPKVEEYAPREYDIVEEKPKRKTAKASSSTLSGSKLGELVNKTTKSTAKKSTSTKSSTKTSTAKKTTAKKTPAKSTSTKSSTTTKKTTEKKTTAPKSDKLSALMNKVATSKITDEKKVDNNVDKVEPVIQETAPEIDSVVKSDESKKQELPKLELPASRPKIKPAKSVTDKEPTNDKDAQLYAALKNSLFSGGTDISEYLTANEEIEMSQQNYQDNRLRQETSKLNEEISKEQQEYEQLFTGSFSSFYDMADTKEENNDTFARDEKNPHDSTYELATGNRNLDQKIADYYKRKQQMIDKYNSEEEDYTETKKKDDTDTPVDYDAIFGGSIMSRDEVLGIKTNTEDTPVTEETPADNNMAEENSVEESAVEENQTQENQVESTTSTENNNFAENNEVNTQVNSENTVFAEYLARNSENAYTENTMSAINTQTPVSTENNVVADTPVIEDTTTTQDNVDITPVSENLYNVADNLSTEENAQLTTILESVDTTTNLNTPVNSNSESITESEYSTTNSLDNENSTADTTTTDNNTLNNETTSTESVDNNISNVSSYQYENTENTTQMSATTEEVPYSNFTGSTLSESTAVNGDNFVMTPSVQPAGEVMEYSNQVPVDFTAMTKVEDMVDSNKTTESTSEQTEERKSLLSAFVSSTPNQPVVDDEDDDEELVIRLDNNEYSEPTTNEDVSSEYPINENNNNEESTNTDLSDTTEEENTFESNTTEEVFNQNLYSYNTDTENNTQIVEENMEVNDNSTEFETTYSNNEDMETTNTFEEISELPTENENIFGSDNETNEHTTMEDMDSTPSYIPPMFDANNTSLDDDNSIVVDSENTISSLELEENMHNEEQVNNQVDNQFAEQTEEQFAEQVNEPFNTQVEEQVNSQSEEQYANTTTEEQYADTLSNEMLDSSVLVDNSTNMQVEDTTAEENDLPIDSMSDNTYENVSEETLEDNTTSSADVSYTDNSYSSYNMEETSVVEDNTFAEDNQTENDMVDVENSEFTSEEAVEDTTISNEEEQLIETYLSEDEHYDYIVTNERLFEEHNRPQTNNKVEDYINEDIEDNTIVMSGIPNTTFDVFGTAQTEPTYTADSTEEIAEDSTSVESATEVSDTISKEEFYKEMARLQDNIINELQGNKVERSTYDFFAEKEPEDVETPTSTPATPVVTSDDTKANSLVDKLIAEVEEESTPSVVEQVMARQMEANTVADGATPIATEMTNTASTPVMEKLANAQPTTPVIDVDVQTPVQPTAESTSVTPAPAVETTPSAEDSLVGSQAEPVNPEDFDKYNLLNKNVALSEEDLKPTTQPITTDKQDNYFYGSNEDKEKKAQIIDEYMTIYNEEAHASKEVGDINIFKSIANAVPSSELLKEDKVEETTTTDTDVDSDLETIYTLMGIQRKPATAKEKEIKVLYCTSECQPFAASGGLADVAGSLPKAIAEKGNVDIRVIMPLYGNIKSDYRDKFEYLGNFTVHLSWRQEYCGLFRYFKDGVTYYFIDNERYFKRDTLYGYYDDGERFAYFSKAIVEALPHLNFFPDIIHCNDWETALVSAYIKTNNWSDHRYYKMRFVYTIHNVEYQGIYGMENLKDLFGIDYRFKNDVEYNGEINLTKTAIQYCDKLTTVSNSYCDNLKQPYCSRGLHHIIIRNEYKLSGIINGIDYSFYNPATDTNLFKNYDIGCLEEKVLNKKLWQDEIGLPVDGDTPMIAIVSRLVGHKGIDLIAKIVHNILQQDIQLVVVGTGEDKYVDLFHSLEQKYPTKVRAFVDKYSNEIARKAYAASDIFVMPSKIEPCGLSQMISSRYGSVPIVREVGGLKDTIRDFGCEGGGNGYTFANYNANDLQYQIERAIKDYSNRTQWREKMKICMSQDYTWGKPALSYIDLYKSISSN